MNKIFVSLVGVFKRDVQSTSLSDFRGERAQNKTRKGWVIYRDRFDGLIRKLNGRLHRPTSTLPILFFSLSQQALKNTLLTELFFDLKTS